MLESLSFWNRRSTWLGCSKDFLYCRLGSSEKNEHLALQELFAKKVSYIKNMTVITNLVQIFWEKNDCNYILGWDGVKYWKYKNINYV